MSLSLAQAFVPSGSFHEPFDPIRDLSALRTLAIWCHRFAPYVGIDHELHKAQVNNELIAISPQHYGIMLDLTGTERIHRDALLLSKNIHSLFKNRARVAIAPTIGGAWALSRFAMRSPVIAKSISELKECANNLPIEALRIDSSTLAKLSDLGIFTIGELMKLPRHSLADRFGKGLVLRLSQLLGATEERPYLITPQERYIQTKIFETPLSHRGAITIVIERMFIALIATLKDANIVARLFILERHPARVLYSRQRSHLTLLAQLSRLSALRCASSCPYLRLQKNNLETQTSNYSAA
jgi:protein ImuB